MKDVLTVRAVRAVAVEVPMRYVLGTSAAAVRAAPLLLVDVETEEGVTGRTYLFCYLAAAAPAIVSLLAEVERAVRGERIAPDALWALLSKRFRLIGVQGIVRRTCRWPRISAGRRDRSPPTTVAVSA